MVLACSSMRFGNECPACVVHQMREVPQLQALEATHVMRAQIEEGKDETEGGLLLTSATKEQPTIGKVRSDAPAALQPGRLQPT